MVVEKKPSHLQQEPGQAMILYIFSSQGVELAVLMTCHLQILLKGLRNEFTHNHNTNDTESEVTLSPPLFQICLIPNQLICHYIDS